MTDDPKPPPPRRPARALIPLVAALAMLGLPLVAEERPRPSRKPDPPEPRDPTADYTDGRQHMQFARELPPPPRLTPPVTLESRQSARARSFHTEFVHAKQGTRKERRAAARARLKGKR